MPNSVWRVDEFPVPVVDPARCTGCGLCVLVCPSQALGMPGLVAAVIHPEACNYTGYCERICPEQAISRPFQIVWVRRKDQALEPKIKSHWVEKVVFSGKEPQPQPLLQNEKAKIILAGLEPGQIIPPHPAPVAVYYFIEGQGWMTVDEERFPVGAGVIVQTADGALRGLEAESRLVFIGAHTL